MGFNSITQDKAEGFAFTDGSSATELLHRIGADPYEVSLKESASEVYAYDGNVYKVTISIEPA